MHIYDEEYRAHKVHLQVALPNLCIKDSEKGIGRFILRKKQAGRSTQLELVTVENEGVLKYII